MKTALICFLAITVQWIVPAQARDQSIEQILHPSQKRTSLKSEPLCAGFENPGTSLGIGLVLVPSQFEIFNDRTLKQKFLHLDMLQYESWKTPVCPLYYQPEYSLMHFTCLEVGDQSYKVLMNSKEIKWLPKKKGYEFKSWDNYILKSWGVDRKDSKKNKKLPLQKEANESAPGIPIPQSGYEMLCPTEMKGDWLKVTYDCNYNLPEDQRSDGPCHDFIAQCKGPIQGWIRWRDRELLRIGIFLRL